jgi:hypothetical protein
MKNTKCEQLLEFYYGVVDENSRLTLEQKMLTDQEWVLDFLDLKRELEASTVFPNDPPIELWQRLSHRMSAPRRHWLKLSIGGAIAASILVAILMVSKQTPPINAVSTISNKSIVLDLSSRTYGNLNVF